ncbi:sensor histidine kinase [Amycolatopsis sp. NPDC051903]|uniref:sensor histidine kinase n=1 Tax=Amycolatopsis sp. NPDC051903 TaxID=3363936 RepID=UPI0037A336E4
MAESARAGTRRLRNALFVVLMLLLTVGGSLGEAYPIQPDDQVYQGHPVPVPPWWAALFVAAATLALAWRRSRPWPVLGVSLTGVGIYTALGYVNGAALLAPLVALFTVAVLSPVRDAILAGVATVVPLGVLTAVVNPLGTFGGTFPVFPVTAGLAVVSGIAVANRRGRLTALQARAELAERTRDEEARRQVDAERLRIARELHDVVAHTMSTINVQAGAAAYAHPGLPEPVTRALAEIKDASKRGLGELRAILAVLRQVDQDEPTQPVPGLHALGSLVATMTAAGLPTVVHTTGAERPLPAPVDVAAYRIIQESLTNALRHAAPATATVTLAYAGGHLDLDVTDTGPGPSADPGAGHGIRGMTERATAAGGTLTTGPGACGGFRVHARLPWEAS